jgi:dihydropteroate synthase
VQAKPVSINVRGTLLDLSVPRVMGIINVTPDSFYGASRARGEKELITRAAVMIEDGADILDIGGYSSRPGAIDISAVEERTRVISAVRTVASEFPGTMISVDTFRSDIALEAINECGAGIINDISGGEADKNMFDLVGRLNVPYIMMHMQGTPGTMQDKPEYDDVVTDIIMWFGKRVTTLHSRGVSDIIIDPGFGFGKTMSGNFELMRRLDEFSIVGLPLMVGISRKSMIWKTLGITADEALNGTSVLNTVALLKGANILRVHDVKEAVQAVKLARALEGS